MIIEDLIDPYEAYDDYLDQHRAESDADFLEGGHDYVDMDAFYADGDTPLTYDEFYQRWIDAVEDEGRYRDWENRYPGARM